MVDSATTWSPARPEQHRANAIDVRTRHEVVAIDLDRREVRARDLDGRRESASRSTSSSTPPARADAPDGPGIDAAGVFGVQTLDDGARPCALAGRRPRPGASSSSAAATSAWRWPRRCSDPRPRRDPRRPLADAESAPSTPTWARRRRRHPRAWHRPASSARRSSGSRPVRTAAPSRWYRRRPAAPGRRRGARARRPPERALAEEAGIPLGTSGGIAVDPRMRHPRSTGVWAAGDCVESVHRLSGQPVHVRARHARQQAGPGGRHQHRRRLRHVPRGHRHGGHQGVRPRGRPHRAVREARPTRPGSATSPPTVESTTRAGYFPGAQPITVKLIAEQRTGRLLGAQIVGREGAAKRIDVLATAIWNEMTRRRDPRPRPVLRAAVRPGLGPGADRRPQSI